MVQLLPYAQESPSRGAGITVPQERELRFRGASLLDQVVKRLDIARTTVHQTELDEARMHGFAEECSSTVLEALTREILSGAQFYLNAFFCFRSFRQERAETVALAALNLILKVHDVPRKVALVMDAYFAVKRDKREEGMLTPAASSSAVGIRTSSAAGHSSAAGRSEAPPKNAGGGTAPTPPHPRTPRDAAFAMGSERERGQLREQLLKVEAFLIRILRFDFTPPTRPFFELLTRFCKLLPDLVQEYDAKQEIVHDAAVSSPPAGGAEEEETPAFGGSFQPIGLDEVDDWDADVTFASKRPRTTGLSSSKPTVREPTNPAPGVGKKRPPGLLCEGVKIFQKTSAELVWEGGFFVCGEGTFS